VLSAQGGKLRVQFLGSGFEGPSTTLSYPPPAPADQGFVFRVENFEFSIENLQLKVQG
jgi:hypothetical protein